MADCSLTITDFPSGLFDYCDPDVNGGPNVLTPSSGIFYETFDCVVVSVQPDGNGKWVVYLTDGSAIYISYPTTSGGSTPPADETVTFPGISGATARIEYA